jgi:superfamily II DNA or RNA helicase
MARHSLNDPMVKVITNQLADLVLREGSVNAALRALAAVLYEDRGEGRLHANRLHTLLSDDPAKSVNTETLETVRLALSRLAEMHPSGDSPGGVAAVGQEQSGRRASPARLDHDAVAGNGTEARQRVLKQWDAAPARLNGDVTAAIRMVADEAQLPPAVVRRVLESSNRLVEPPHEPRRIERPGPTEPDWSFQDLATERCLEALRRGPDRKVGLILPTGAGKTRVAMRVVLQVVADSRRDDSVVLWVTHRTRLRTQAHRELQRAITEGTPGLPEGAADLLARRVVIAMISELPDLLSRYGGRVALAVVDEAHHAAAPSYQALFEHRPIRGLFLTATPNRTDELPIGIDEIAYSITYRELFERGVIIEPTIEDPLTIDGFDWDNDEHVSDLADYILDRAEDDFVKTLAVTSRVEHVKRLHNALQRELLDRPGHILDVADLFYAYGTSSSTGEDVEELLDQFTSVPRGILVATAQLLGEGFDDPSINAVVVTYPTTSIIQLMQAAGRCLRTTPGKTKAYIVQVRDSDLAYHFEQRWLYQDISDALHPQLTDIEYSSLGDLETKLGELLTRYRVGTAAASAVRDAILGLQERDGGALLLTGLPFDGSPENFSTSAAWSCVPVAAANRHRFLRVFNDFSAREADVAQPAEFLASYLQPDSTPGSEWRLLTDMLWAMDYAQKEISGTPYAGDENRGYAASKGTTWLTYATFSYRPAIPGHLEEFLADALNRDDVSRSYTTAPTAWASAAKITLPLGGTWAYLLTPDQDQWLRDNRAVLIRKLTSTAASEAFAELARWRQRLTASPLPQLLIERFDTFVAETGIASYTCDLRTTP